jgi:hypothetical protein
VAARAVMIRFQSWRKPFMRVWSVTDVTPTVSRTIGR